MPNSPAKMAYNARYREANKAKIAAYDREYYAAHRDAILRQQRDYKRRRRRG
jgi:hypothetical protein